MKKVDVLLYLLALTVLYFYYLKTGFTNTLFQFFAFNIVCLIGYRFDRYVYCASGFILGILAGIYFIWG